MARLVRRPPGGNSRVPQTPSTGPLRGRTLRVSWGCSRESDLGRAQCDRVPAAELRALHALAVDLDPVRRAEVDDPVRGAFLPQLCVPARDVGVGELDVAVARAAD